MKFKYVIMSLLVVVLLCGCGGTKTSKDPSEIQSILENANFDVYDTTDQVGYADTALYGVKGQVKANYVKGNKKYDIQGIFLDECKNIYNKVEADYKKEDNGGDNWTYLIVTDSEHYYFVGWIEDSYIAIESPADQEKLMNNLVKDLGFK